MYNTISTERIVQLLEQINQGQAAKALPYIERLLKQHKQHPALHSIRAEALRLLGKTPAAIDAYKMAAVVGAGERNWQIAGILLAAERRIDEALECLKRAISEAPENDAVLDTLITTLFNANRHQEGIVFARRQLTKSRNPQFISHAALLLSSNALYDEATEAFRAMVNAGEDSPVFLGSALSATRFTCDWSLIDTLQKKILACYNEKQFSAPSEYPLTNITWCTDEMMNLGVTQAYCQRVVPVVPPVSRRNGVFGGRIRVGYLSSDFCNHATMHLMAGLFECHDKSLFEIFAYDHSRADISQYRQRFLSAIDHHVAIDSLTDHQAALRIADDQLDILFDLKGHTGWSRFGILAYRPAPVQAAYLGYPGSTASPHIDYIVSDQFVTPDSSMAYYTEELCRLPNSYQCNDRQRPITAMMTSRTACGLQEDKIVFCAFNQSYKIDRMSFALWMRVLQEVPHSVLWLLAQSDAARTNLSREAEGAGIDPKRLVFAPGVSPEQHLARLQLADAALDTLVCNGHTTTSDALWAGIPVITARGSHFASRVSESLLNAMELPELVGANQDDMVNIARRIGTDASYRATLRQKVAEKRLTAPLFDTVRFTRNFEKAIEMMTHAYRTGMSSGPIDVPDRKNGMDASPARGCTPNTDFF